MPPGVTSRYLASVGAYDDVGRTYLTEREPYRYDPHLSGVIRHVVGSGDSLQSIAYRYYSELAGLAGSEDVWGPEHLWWLIAEFQPLPILDPTLGLEVGQVIYVPPPSAVVAHLGAV
jgi:hypothetical protein